MVLTLLFFVFVCFIFFLHYGHRIGQKRGKYIEYTAEKFPFFVRYFSTFERIFLAPFGVNLVDMSYDAIISAARQKTGLHDLGDFEPFEVMIKAKLESFPKYFERSESTSLNKFVLRDSIINGVCNILKLVEILKNNPEIKDIELPEPDFIIVGPPRTGSTFLYNLMSLNPESRSPMLYEINDVKKGGDFESWDQDPRIKVQTELIERTNKMIPELKNIHFNTATSPEEDWFFTKQFGVDTLNFVMDFEFWENWFEDHPAETTFYHEFLKSFLQVLIWQNPYSCSGKIARFFTRKSPCHSLFLSTVRKIWPEARMIQTHRDMAKVVGSMSSLARIFGIVTQGRIDLEILGKNTLNMIKKMEETLREWRKNEEAPVCDIKFLDFVSNPVETVVSVYKFFGEEVSEEFIIAMKEFVNNKSLQPPKRHKYSLEKFGLKKEEIHKIFEEYHRIYGVTLK